VLPVLVGLFALMLAAVFAVVTVDGLLRGDDAENASGGIATKRFVHRSGGFSVEVPRGMKRERSGRTATFRTHDRSLVVSVGPGSRGPLRATTRRLLGSLRETYASVRVTGSERQQVDGRPALSTAGKARNGDGVRIRFVATVVRARPENYVVAAYTAHDSDPAVVLPRLHAIVNGFAVRRPRGG